MLYISDISIKFPFEDGEREPGWPGWRGSHPVWQTLLHYQVNKNKQHQYFKNLLFCSKYILYSHQDETRDIVNILHNFLKIIPISSVQYMLKATVREQYSPLEFGIIFTMLQIGVGLILSFFSTFGIRLIPMCFSCSVMY